MTVLYINDRYNNIDNEEDVDNDNSVISVNQILLLVRYYCI